MRKKYKVLQPKYVQMFKCIGSACEHNCCHSWTIPIDKKSYQSYKKCPNSEMKLKLAKNVIRNRSNSGDDDTYAKIKLNADGNCPFLGEDKLCSIQLNLGEKYLSTTCASYPRAYSIVNEILEISLALSCPEAARIALLNDSLMEFELSEQDVSHIRGSINILESKNILLEQYFEALRIFTISVLQNRLYPLWQRLVVLGLFYDNLDKVMRDNKINGISDMLNFIETYRKHLDQGTFLTSLESIPNNLELQEEILKILVPVTYDKDNDYPQKGELSDQCQETIANYTVAYENYYRPVADKHEYIFENYLVNYVFKNLFPFKGEKHMFDNYVALIANYASIKTLLIRTAGLSKERFNSANIVTGIQFFCRSVEHDGRHLQAVSNFLKSNNFNNMAYMSILIKH